VIFFEDLFKLSEDGFELGGRFAGAGFVYKSGGSGLAQAKKGSSTCMRLWHF